MLHVQSINIVVPIIEATNLEDISTINNDESWVQFANRNVWQLLPRIIIDLKAPAVMISNWNRPHSHIQHKVRGTARDYNFLPTDASTVCKFSFRHTFLFTNITRVVCQFKVLVRDTSILKVAATKNVDKRL